MPRSCNYFSQKDEYQHRAHNKNLLYVHLIFSIKYRKSLLFGNFDSDIKQWIYNICKRNHWYIQRMESDKNHLHILLQYNPTDSICKIVRKLKQMTTYYAWKKYPIFLKNHFWKEHTLWSDGYFACSVGNTSKEGMRLSTHLGAFFFAYFLPYYFSMGYIVQMKRLTFSTKIEYWSFLKTFRL